MHEEANGILRRVLIRNPDYCPAHVRLTILYSESGWMAEARAELAEVVRIYPRLSLELSTRAVQKPCGHAAVYERPAQSRAEVNRNSESLAISFSLSIAPRA
jgi:hypothetical protein